MKSFKANIKDTLWVCLSGQFKVTLRLVSLLPVFVNKVLLQHSYATMKELPVAMFALLMEELSHCYRDQMSDKA